MNITRRADVLFKKTEHINQFNYFKLIFEKFDTVRGFIQFANDYFFNFINFIFMNKIIFIIYISKIK
jgi:hypothetical protein